MMDPVDAVQREWGASGLAHLTGLPSGPPDFSRAGVLAAARSTAANLHRHLGVAVDAGELLTGRAALLGLTRRGRISPGGATRLLATRDGWCALTLSRPDDVEAVPALIESAARQDDPWQVVRAWAGERSSATVVDRARLLDLPAAVLGETAPCAPAVRRVGPTAPPRELSHLVVVDLSSMWAGPLCGQLLRRAGATVVKLESAARPDGTRAGSPAFFDWVNAGKICGTIDFDDLSRLRALLEAADVVIESSRPSALGRRGLGPDDVTARPGRVWVRISGYSTGREHPAFGDDAAVAGGLVGRSSDGPVFCGDAIADPLTGLHATLAVAESLARGGGEVVEVAMAAVAATYAALPQLPGDARWDALFPRPPAPQPRASDVGADDDSVDRLIEERSATSC